MKGHFGRQRIDRPHPTIAVDSYETAVYPPRSYRCHTFDFSVEPDQNTVMLPSIDSDSICNPFTKDLQSANKAQRRPSLREYFFCYVSSSRQKQPSNFPALEPLNVLHYPELHSSGDVAMGWPSLTKAIAFPAELVPLHSGRGSSAVEILAAPEKLKIQSSFRRKPPKPTRRGGTVTVSDNVKSPFLLSQRRKRSRNEDENADDGDEGSNAAEELDSDNDDEASIGLCDDDDDDVEDGIDSGSEGPLI